MTTLKMKPSTPNTTHVESRCTFVLPSRPPIQLITSATCTIVHACHRAAAATAPDPIGPPRTFELTQDQAWAVVLASADGEVTLSTSTENTKTFQVTAGVNKLAVPIVPGGTLNAQLVRDGATVVNLATPGTDFTFNGVPETFNYNIFVASA